FERLKHMLIKEFIQIFRDPRMKSVIFFTPVFQMLVFGYAVNTDVDHITTAVYDLDNSVVSRELVARFENSGYFNIEERIDNDHRLNDLMDRGKVKAVLRANKGFGENLQAGKTAVMQLIVDGTDSNTAQIVLNYSAKIIRQYSLEQSSLRFSRITHQAKNPGRVELETRAWFNENLESRNFYLLGVIGLLVMVTTILLTSMAVVREKEIGTMEQIMVTPIISLEFILGKTIPFALIGFLEVLIVSLIAIFWFEIPFRGNLMLLIFSTGLYLMTTLGTGLYISTISRTQQQAMMTTFFYIFPASLLSGFVFPVQFMPEFVQWIT
ncbi:MAG: ABC transporter permease, partial [Desulfobacterales bacterium]